MEKDISRANPPFKFKVVIMSPCVPVRPYLDS